MPTAKLPAKHGRAIIAALNRAGFVVIRVSGSHHILRRVGEPARKVTVPVHGGKALPPGTLRSIIRQAGLTVAEFIDLL
jgi:predicted RNA binding protein YcfA (HicA-like mRNA interferase family)